MKFTIPIYVCRYPAQKDSAAYYQVQPLFAHDYQEHNELLNRALTRLAQKLRRAIQGTDRVNEAAVLSWWSFCPELKERRSDVPIRLRRRVASCRYLLVSWQALGRTIAFTPSVPKVWFELHEGESVAERASEVLSHYFKRVEETMEELRPEELSIKSEAFITTLTIEIFLPTKEQENKRSASPHAFLLAEERVSGEAELEKTGECWDLLYPDDLDRALLRDQEVEELTSLLQAPDKRPVLLLGPRQSGKTAIIHECLYRLLDRRGNPYRSRGKLWHLSPQRLISGMSRVGEWENRILAILREASRRDYILYFDDLLGLYLAGISLESSLNMAQVIKPYIEGHEFRLLAEITPEAFRVLQERDRGFADLFHILRVREMTRAETLRIMVSTLRQYERRDRSRFAIEVLPTIMDLQGRYGRDAALPGKVASFARHLAVKMRNDKVERSDVLEEFHSLSGMPAAFIDGRERLMREEIEAGIRAHVIGQGRAVRAMTDIICRAKARLNDPERPLGTLLFVGPTGVGKTQCAKAVAAYLYGDAGRLLRFDMNEFSDAASAARLIGDFTQPEGLLTSEIRRRPFCVLLLDEIEKAHADVFDLLLQVLGEGRLTDALGRTANFHNVLIILTSNLGARQVRARFGFLQEDHAEDAIYIDAARQFFRPEFFNRLDQIIPFSELSRSEIATIAERLIREVMGRQGMQQRRCALKVDPAAMARLVEAGYHPRLGARAIKRIVEQQLAQPVANCLAALPPGVPTVITAYAGPEGITVNTQGLFPAARLPVAATRSERDLPAAVGAFFERAERAIETIHPAGPLTVGQIDPVHHHYLAINEQIRYIRRLHSQLADMIVPSRQAASAWRGSIRARQPAWEAAEVLSNWKRGSGSILQQLTAADSIRDALKELEEQPDLRRPLISGQIRNLLAECGLMEAMLRSSISERILICCRSSDGRHGDFMPLLRNLYKSLCAGILGFSFEEIEAEPESGCMGAETGHPSRTDLAGWVIAGPGASALAGLESGAHLLMTGQELRVAVLRMIPLAGTENPAELLGRETAAHIHLMQRLANGTAQLEEDPFRSNTVLRLYEIDGMTVDFRTGLAGEGISGRERVQGTDLQKSAGFTSVMQKQKVGERRFHSMVLAALPVPPELLQEG